MYTTVRRKFGSWIDGEAMRSWPLSVPAIAALCPDGAA
jgi:hypothetical protein